jgi:hypothetical protein
MGAFPNEPVSLVRLLAPASLPYEMVGAAGQASEEEAAVLVFPVSLARLAADGHGDTQSG